MDNVLTEVDVSVSVAQIITLAPERAKRIDAELNYCERYGIGDIYGAWEYHRCWRGWDQMKAAHSAYKLATNNVAKYKTDIRTPIYSLTSRKIWSNDYDGYTKALAMRMLQVEVARRNFMNVNNQQNNI